MPPQRTSDGGTSRTQAKSNKNKGRAREPNPFDSDEQEEHEDAEEDEEEEVEEVSRRSKNTGRGGRGAADEEEEAEPEKTIPKDLLTRLLHEFFAKDATRLSRDANAAVGKYVDVFVREAIARTAVEKHGGFLEVEDLEKVTPQLLLDL